MAPSIRQFLLLAAAAGALLMVRALVAALEAALVAVGTPRAQELAADPSSGRRARALASLLAEPETTAFTLRATVTFATIFAGVLAAAAGAAIAPGSPWLAGTGIAAAAVLLSLPLAAGARGIGAAHGELVALALAPPFRLARWLARPAAALVGFMAGKRARFSNPPPPLDEMERALAEYARAHGAAGATTTELIHAVFEFRDKIARDVMVPRTDVVALDVDTPVQEILRLMAEEGHSRMPIYRASLDHILGILHARDLVPMLAHPELIVLRDILRPAHFVPWSKPVDQLLREMQRRKLHMALVVDEYGGVMGVCTLEDVLEQIVGAIGDEFEQEVGRSIEAHGDGTFTVQGATPIAEFNAVAAAAVPDDQGFETVAGFLNSLAGAIPAKGDRFFWRGWVFTVADGDPRKVTKVRAARVKRA